MKQISTLYVISHTHWDREWYDTFQNYRFRLVRMMDDLLELMENCQEYRYFHLDGQTIVLEDYLEIRPENEQRLRKLIRERRILIGPWYVMPDEFLISGESLVRNLQKGISICQEYGTEFMKNGYVTDIFGHNSQLPQIMRGFGIDSATLFRGIGDYPRDAFWWEGSDGSRLRVLKLDSERCYSNFYFSLRWPYEGKEIVRDDLIKRAKEILERSKNTAVCEAYLMMDGVDHIDADLRLPEIIKLLNENIEGITVKHATIEEYLDAIECINPQLEILKGPLYHIGKKGQNNLLLKNVLSSMVHLKQANDECETELTGWSEPFDFAASQCLNEYIRGQNIRHVEPRREFLDRAWKYLLQNHPHDSICGCSISDVHRDNEYRFRQALQIAKRITVDSLECIAENIDTSCLDGDFCFVVFNPSQKVIDEYIVLSFDFLPDIRQNFKLFDICGNEVPYQILDVTPLNFHRVAPIRKLIEFQQKETCMISAKLVVPANGYTTLSVKAYKDTSNGEKAYVERNIIDRTRYLGTMRIARNKWDNGLLLLEVAGNGTLMVTNKKTGRKYENILTFEDCADIGDGWNFVNPVNNDEYLSVCGECDFAIKSDGPFAVVLELTRRMMLPNSTVPNNNRRNTICY